MKTKSKLTNRGALELANFFQSHKDGAAKINVHPSHFSLLVSGKRKPSIEVAAQIEKIWGVPCRYWTEVVEIQDKKRDKK